MLAHRLARQSIHRHGLQSRNFSFGPLREIASQEFLDLATVIPFPPSLPPYSGTIILVSLLIRAAYVPLNDWVRVHLLLLRLCN